MLPRILLAVVAVGLLSFTYGGKKERATFTVYGECGMCESRIEKALNKVEGIDWADWEKETLELTVKYDPSVITLEQIKQKVADVGHDTESIKAKDEVYENLHPCCKYERPKK